MQYKGISVIIPVFNNAQRLEKALDALCRQEYPDSLYEIIVIDNGSDDGSPEIAQSFGNETCLFEKYGQFEEGARSGEDYRLTRALILIPVAAFLLGIAGLAVLLGIFLLPLLVIIKKKTVQFSHVGFVAAAAAEPGHQFARHHR
ncbi:MAG: glycosyltransferase family 2 protein [Desulfosalsimonas sp.]